MRDNQPPLPFPSSPPSPPPEPPIGSIVRDGSSMGLDSLWTRTESGWRNPRSGAPRSWAYLLDRYPPLTVVTTPPPGTDNNANASDGDDVGDDAGYDYDDDASEFSRQFAETHIRFREHLPEGMVQRVNGVRAMDPLKVTFGHDPRCGHYTISLSIETLAETALETDIYENHPEKAEQSFLSGTKALADHVQKTGLLLNMAINDYLGARTEATTGYTESP